MTPNTASYRRVLPRDLFNEASLLKCYGRLWLLLERHMGEGAQMSEEVPWFMIVQRPEDGWTYIKNLPLRVGRRRFWLTRPLNSRAPWPLFAQEINSDSEPIEVFDDCGNLSKAFSALVEEAKQGGPVAPADPDYDDDMAWEKAAQAQEAKQAPAKTCSPSPEISLHRALQIAKAVKLLTDWLDDHRLPPQACCSHLGTYLKVGDLLVSLLSRKGALLVCLYDSNRKFPAVWFQWMRKALSEELGAKVSDGWNGLDMQPGVSLVFDREAPTSLHEAMCRETSYGGFQKFEKWIDAARRKAEKIALR